MTESGVTGRGLQVARTLVPNLLTHVPVRMINVLDYQVTWEKGSIVSTLEPVDVIPSPVLETRLAVDKSFKTELLTAVDEELKPEEMRNLSQLIDEYNDVFSQGEYDFGCTNLVMHGIDTGDHKAIRQPLRRHPPPHAEAIRE